jgi:hypothetical protein
MTNRRASSWQSAFGRSGKWLEVRDAAGCDRARHRIRNRAIESPAEHDGVEAPHTWLEEDDSPTSTIESSRARVGLSSWNFPLQPADAASLVK